MTSIAEKMVAGGSCLTRIDGKAVFVPMALPGETVELEITESRKDYAFARIVSVLDPSPHRITPPCPHFAKCGGCSLQMADPAYQTELRLSILRDVLSRAHVSPEAELRVESGNPFGYRSRFQFHRTASGGIGLKEGSSSSLVEISDCPVAVPEIRAALADGSLARTARQHNTGDRFHVFAYDGNLWHEDGDTDCTVRMAGGRIRFDVRGFFQSNVPMLERMLAAASRPGRTAGGRLLDFYSGVGTFSLFAGRDFQDLVLVEHNKEALDLARDNLAGRERPPVLCPVSDERWPGRKEAKLGYDAAIIDPPRQGMHQGTLDWFIRSGIRDLRYVSCDPVTFARDAAKLVAGGYRLEEVTLFDFYPQTHHLETFGVFTR